jgi:LAS superfamily LD-carboxypeptidase LdcB
MSRRAIHLVLALVFGIGGAVSLASEPPMVRGTIQPEAADVESIRVAAITDVVVYPTPIPIGFVGPARFAGVSFSRDGSAVTPQKWFGTIVRVNRRADQTQLVNGVPYAHIIEGSLSGLWVKVNASLTRARGKAPRPPDCRYDDVLTSRRSYSKHAVTLLDTIYKVGSSYAPSDLRDTGKYSLNSGYLVRSIIGSDLSAMATAARAAGAPIQVVSGYRSYAQQKATFDYWVSVSGYQQALLTSARPGHSEHQLGTTIDVTSRGGAAPWSYADWGTTAAGAWMTKHAWKHGFLMTYPKGKTSLSCYSYEPWHYRYVGKPIAAAVRASGMTLREAIWAAYGP